MKEVILLASAEADLHDHYKRLDEAVPGMGAMLDEEIDRLISTLSKHPGRGSYQPTGHRRLLLPRWRLAFFYREYPTRCTVGAVLDLRQNPGMILRRLEES